MRPFETIAGLAQKVQVVATRVALKAAKLSEAMARKVATIEARAAARVQARAHAAELKALPRKPTVEFLREVGHGRTSLTFYKVTDHRAGEVRHLWALNRITPEGQRVRLVTGTKAEFRDLQTIVKRLLAQEVKARQGVEGSPTQRAKSQDQRHGSAVASRPPQGERPEDNRPQTRWYTLIYVGKLAPDGTGKGRVVRNLTSLEKAQALQKQHPGLIIQERTAQRPLPQGKEVDVKLSCGVRVAEGVGVPRQNGVKQEGPKLAVFPPAQKQQYQLTQGR